VSKAQIVCAACGEHNDADADFCGECGAFLEWEGRSPAALKDADIAATAAPDEPAAAPAGAVAVETSSAAPGQQGTAGQPRTVQPGEQIRRRPTKAPAPPRPVAPGELACPNCGAGNDKKRRFCRSCGAPLTPAAVPGAPRPWWRRFLSRLFGRRRFDAGFRRRVRQKVRIPRLPIVLGLGAILAIIGVGPARPSINKGITEVRDRISKHIPVTPTGFASSSSRSGHDPRLVADRVSNSYWSPQGRAAEWIQVKFPRPIRLLDIVITPGVSIDAPAFQAQGRPQQVDIVATAKNGRTTRKTVTLLDQAGEQKFALKADDVVQVRFTIRSAYGLTGSRVVGIAELEFFARG